MLRRNVIVLILSQAIGNSGMSLVTLLGGIIGSVLAPTPALATLPISLTIGGMALFTLPASFIMRRFGRRAGFQLGACFVIAAGLLAAYAISQESFPLFCLATLMVGVNTAFVQQYRFAAIESVPPQYISRVVSLVLLGGIVAGFLGPEVARRTQFLLPTQYAGSFLGMAAMAAVALVVLAWLQNIAPREAEVTGAGRPLAELGAQPVFRAAVVSGAVGYAVMSFIMTATPVNLHKEHYSLDQSALVIQSHIVAMFLPSLFTGILIERLGLLRVMSLGVLALMGTVALALVNRELIHYWGALVLLGVGWNFLFVGSTVLLPRAYLPAERFKVQAANDFLVFGVQAVASFSSGTVLAQTTWEWLNLTTVPFLVLVMIALISIRRQAAPLPERVVGGTSAAE